MQPVSEDRLMMQLTQPKRRQIPGSQPYMHQPLLLCLRGLRPVGGHHAGAAEGRLARCTGGPPAYAGLPAAVRI